ncbi:hypothetical protein CCUG60885_02741 [Mycobacteroides salmoniphilum]|uniref:Uncharacterized protein n=1 Tax=Mycobacteroides salmoniphilum TaxID=404941 RepID=A0A4R8SI33_9MYCO|nr:hypothetical protein CCUG60885_02741 [Mycobacteroides salmoniphilum]TEA05692.1 hypothetical protein CCUG60883_02998 [Mycobacteroides salmoniphilum]
MQKGGRVTTTEPGPAQPLPPVKKYTFHADTAAIRKCAKTYHDLADTKNTLTNYINKWLTVDASDGVIFVLLRNVINDAHNDTAKNAETLERLVDDSADELDGVAKMYDETETSRAAQFDRTNCSPNPGNV